eukprot:scaffold3980_cov348-Prasinococcus_capsulatus_cf.AAC.2
MLRQSPMTPCLLALRLAGAVAYPHGGTLLPAAGGRLHAGCGAGQVRLLLLTGPQEIRQGHAAQRCVTSPCYARDASTPNVMMMRAMARVGVDARGGVTA